MTVTEYPLQGRKEIIAYLGWSEAKFYRKLSRLLAAGRVFYEWHGKPPHKMLVSYPSLLLEFRIKRALEGEIL